MSGRDGKRTRSSHPLSTSAQRTPSLLSAPPTTAGMAAQAGRGRLGCARSLSPPAWGPLLCTCKDGFHPFLHGAGKAWRGGGLAVGVATSLGSLQPPSPRRGAQRAQAAAVRAGSRGERGAGGRGERPRESTLGGGGAGGRWPQRARRVGPRARGRDWRLSRWLAAMPTPSPRPTVSSSNLTKIWEVGLLPTWQRVKQRRGRVHTGSVRREGHVQTRVPNGYRRNEGGARDAPPRRARAHRRRRPGGERSVARLPPLSSRSGTVCRLEGYKKPVRRELTHLWERGLEGREGPKPSPTPQTTASGLGRGRFSSRRTSYMLSCPSSCLDTHPMSIPPPTSPPHGAGFPLPPHPGGGPRQATKAARVAQTHPPRGVAV